MYKISEVCKIPWGTDLKEEFISPPETGLYKPDSKSNSKIRKNFLFRVSRNSCLVLSGQALTPDQHPEISFLQICGNQVIKKKIIIIRRLQQYKVVDFVITENQGIAVLIENVEHQEVHYLFVTRQIDGTGKEYEITIPADQPYFDIRKIRKENENIYFDVKLSAGRGLFAITLDGVLEPVYQNRLALGLFITGKEFIVAALSNPGHSENYWARIRIPSGEELMKLSNPLYNAHNAVPLFVTSKENVYGTKGFEIVRQNFNSADVEIINFRSLIPLPGKEFVLCTGFSKTDVSLVRTHHQETTGQKYLTLQLPVAFHDAVYCNLESIDSNGSFYIRVKTKDAGDIFIEYSQTGIFTGQLSADNKINSYSLQNSDTWQVDEDNQLYLPVQSKKGLDIFKITFLKK